MPALSRSGSDLACPPWMPIDEPSPQTPRRILVRTPSLSPRSLSPTPGGMLDRKIHDKVTSIAAPSQNNIASGSLEFEMPAASRDDIASCLDLELTAEQWVLELEKTAVSQDDVGSGPLQLKMTASQDDVVSRPSQENIVNMALEIERKSQLERTALEGVRDGDGSLLALHMPSLFARKRKLNFSRSPLGSPIGKSDFEEAADLACHPWMPADEPSPRTPKHVIVLSPRDAIVGKMHDEVTSTAAPSHDAIASRSLDFDMMSASRDDIASEPPDFDSGMTAEEWVLEFEKTAVLQDDIAYELAASQWALECQTESEDVVVNGSSLEDIVNMALEIERTSELEWTEPKGDIVGDIDGGLLAMHMPSLYSKNRKAVFPLVGSLRIEEQGSLRGSAEAYESFVTSAVSGEESFM